MTHKLLNNVLLVEDQPSAKVLLEGILTRLYPQANITTSITVAHALAQLDRNWSMALVDLRLLDGSGLEVLKAIKACQPLTPTIVTTTYSDDDSIFSALQAGADGYLLKTESPAQLQAQLQAMARGEVPLSPAVARRVLQFFRQPMAAHAAAPSIPPAPDAEALTQREAEVLAAICEGLSIRETAARLGISYHTTNGYLKAVYRKLGIRCRAQAVVEAQRRGLA